MYKIKKIWKNLLKLWVDSTHLGAPKTKNLPSVPEISSFKFILFSEKRRLNFQMEEFPIYSKKRHISVTILGLTLNDL